jgi:hypothetical protein
MPINKRPERVSVTVHYGDGTSETRDTPVDNYLTDDGVTFTTRVDHIETGYDVKVITTNQITWAEVSFELGELPTPMRKYL